MEENPGKGVLTSHANPNHHPCVPCQRMILSTPGPGFPSPWTPFAPSHHPQLSLRCRPIAGWPRHLAGTWQVVYTPERPSSAPETIHQFWLACVCLFDCACVYVCVCDQNMYQQSSVEVAGWLWYAGWWALTVDIDTVEWTFGSEPAVILVLGRLAGSQFHAAVCSMCGILASADLGWWCQVAGRWRDDGWKRVLCWELTWTLTPTGNNVDTSWQTDFMCVRDSDCRWALLDTISKTGISHPTPPLPLLPFGLSFFSSFVKSGFVAGGAWWLGDHVLSPRVCGGERNYTVGRIKVQKYLVSYWEDCVSHKTLKASAKMVDL